MPTASTAPHPTRLKGRRPSAPRRTSGPGRAVAAAPRGLAPGGTTAALEPLGLRLVRRARALPDAPVLDRLIRGRMWIGVLAVALLGVVFLQVSLLKLNTGIGRAVQSSQTLELQNVELRRQIAQADQGDQLQDIAGAKGMVMPAPGDVGYVRAGAVDAARAAANITKPNDPATVAATQEASPAVSGTAAAADAATPPVVASSAAPATAAPAATSTPDATAAAASTPAAAPTTSSATDASGVATATPDATSAAGTATPVTP
jgi:hypothetical protein